MLHFPSLYSVPSPPSYSLHLFLSSCSFSPFYVSSLFSFSSFHLYCFNLANCCSFIAPEFFFVLHSPSLPIVYQPFFFFPPLFLSLNIQFFLHTPFFSSALLPFPLSLLFFFFFFSPRYIFSKFSLHYFQLRFYCSVFLSPSYFLLFIYFFLCILYIIWETGQGIWWWLACRSNSKGQFSAHWLGKKIKLSIHFAVDGSLPFSIQCNLSVKNLENLKG